MKATENELIFIYNSQDQNDKKALGYVQSLDQYVVKNWDISENPLTETQIAMVAAQLEKSPADLIDRHSELYKENMETGTYSQHEALKILKHNPLVMQTPIMLTEKGGHIMTSPFELNDQLVKTASSDKF